MGEVYRARDTRLNRDVALKVLPPAFAGDPERMARFEREAQVLASLNHPNIAQLYGLEGHALVMARTGRISAVEVATTPGFRLGTPQSLQYTLAGPSYGWDVALDGQRFLTAKPAEQKQDQAAAAQLHVVMEWFEELKRRAPPGRK
jgi:serine/threonine protein kinase